ncbi:MAG: lipocalin family protein [Bacteroidales bacterium]|nr:lipocalin family protein [Bacteroidales bacterium]
MKKIFWLGAMVCALGMMIACEDDNTQSENEELIVGIWDVQSLYWWMHDITDETYAEETNYVDDSSYSGYDAVEFNRDGTSRWYMSDRMVHNGGFDNPYKTFNWQIKGDSLFVYAGETIAYNPWECFAIQTLDGSKMVIESYYNNGHAEYSHHHLEQIKRYSLNRRQ